VPKDFLKYVTRTNLARYHERIRYWITVIQRGEGIGVKECPACGYIGKFKAYGHPPRYNAACPKCGSLERHRLFCLALRSPVLVSEGEKVIHFAPETVIGEMLAGYHVDYLTADIVPGRAALTLNMEQISLPDKSVDVVVTNHVLEHVDDKAALMEIHRVLKDGGRLLATVPMIEGWEHTYENPRVSDDAGRELHFGQHDHVRFYGRDFRERVRAAGFTLDEFVCNGADSVQYGLSPGERLFIGKKN
jgi:SAM-dependent methyltransferase